MLGPRGLVKVLDFGIARNLRLELQEAAFEPTHSSTEDLGKHDLTRTVAASRFLTESRVLGTPGYCSPEQILAAPVDERADCIPPSGACCFFRKKNASRELVPSMVKPYEGHSL
jgi:serine/threonine protein kinase